MKNVSKYQEKNIALRLFENLFVNVLALCLVVGGIAAVVIVCKISFAAFMLLPDEIRNPILCVSLFALVSVVLWKIKEVLAMFALVGALFS